MKKIFCLSFVFIISTSLMFAQKFHFGLGITPSLAWLHPGSDDIKGDGSKFGFNYGLMTEFAFTDNYSFATGLTIDRKGGKLRSSEVIVDSISSDYFYFEYNLSYIDIPATIKMKTNQIGSMRYYGQFGLAPGFLISAKGNSKHGQTSTDDIDIKEDVNNFNVSLVIGLGLEYNLSGNTNLLAGFVYKNGFTDIIDGTTKGNVNTLGLNIGVLF